MKRLHDIEIIQGKDRATTVKIDGKEIAGVTDVSYSNSTLSGPKVCIELIPGTLNLNTGDVMEVTSLEENYKQFLKKEEE